MKNSVSYDRRSFPRQQSQYVLNVNSQLTGRKFGHILDVSLEGIRMVCDKPVKREEVYDLSFHLPPEIYGDDEIHFSALSIWTRPGPRQGTSVSGFKVTQYWQRTNNHVALSSVISDYESFLRNIHV
ncbi:hypothetical protein AB833_29010 [Chromatiales bacterium (ex Bugula neritina AB1)]|nr:hypothetical protein AB833_29010 [Chromatiales bacterium (ex Bugula neritina AB1)]